MKERRTSLPPVPLGEIGQPNGWTPESEADHFMQCPGCGEWINCRDLGMVFQHAGELPHGPGTKRQ